jgi:hypothetical protein
MNAFLAKSILVAGILALVMGCSADRAQLISQPSAVKPGDTIPVVLSDVYLMVSTTQSTTAAFTRDSLHVVFGLPAGWSVLSANYYVASGLKINQITSVAANATLLAALLQDSLPAYQSKSSAMFANPSWKSYFSNKTLYAHDYGTDSIPVNVNSVGQWLPYGAKIGLNYPVGTVMDTSFAVSSLPIDTSTIPSGAKFLFGSIKTIWVKTVPIVCFARIIVGSAQDSFNLYYFTKTDSIPSTAVSLIPNYDKGDMTYAKIDVNILNAVRLQPSCAARSALFRVTSGSGATTRFDLGGTGGKLSICDVSGKAVQTFDRPGSQSIVWDGTTALGSAAQTGLYVARYESRAGVASQTLKIIR